MQDNSMIFVHSNVVHHFWSKEYQIFIYNFTALIILRIVHMYYNLLNNLTIIIEFVSLFLSKKDTKENFNRIINVLKVIFSNFILEPISKWLNLLAFNVSNKIYAALFAEYVNNFIVFNAELYLVLKNAAL